MKTTLAILTRPHHRPRFSLGWARRCNVCHRRWPCPSVVFHQVIADLDAGWLVTLLTWSESGVGDLDFQQQPVPERFQRLLKHAVEGVEAAQRPQDPRVGVLAERLANLRFLLGETEERTDSRGRHLHMISIKHVREAMGDIFRPGDIAALDECGLPFPCAHRAYDPRENHPAAAS